MNVVVKVQQDNANCGVNVKGMGSATWANDGNVRCFSCGIRIMNSPVSP
jgi:hypothetical protein